MTFNLEYPDPTQSMRVNVRESSELETFMAATRRLESGSYQGNYSAQGRYLVKQQDRAIGAYQIMSRNWPTWSSAAGIPRANWRDPKAQDRVARYQMEQYWQRFQNWELVATAWYSGASRAQRVYDRYGSGATNAQIEQVLGGAIADYAGKVASYAAEAPDSAWGRENGAIGLVPDPGMALPAQQNAVDTPGGISEPMSPQALTSNEALLGVLDYMAGPDRIPVDEIEVPETQEIQTESEVLQ